MQLAGSGYVLRGGTNAPAGRPVLRRRWRAGLLARPRHSYGLGARRSALGARRSALGARRSALGGAIILRANFLQKVKSIVGHSAILFVVFFRRFHDASNETGKANRASVSNDAER